MIHTALFGGSVTEEVIEKVFHGVSAPVVSIAVAITVVIVTRILLTALIRLGGLLLLIILCLILSSCSFVFMFGGRLRLGIYSDVNFHFLALAVDVEAKDGARFGIRNYLYQVFGTSNILVIHFRDHIVSLDAGFVSRRVFGDFVNHCTCFDAGNIGCLFLAVSSDIEETVIPM